MLMLVICDHTWLHATEDRNSKLGGGAGASTELAKSFWKRVEACQTVAIPITLWPFLLKAGQNGQGFFFFFTQFTTLSTTLFYYLPRSHELAKKKNALFSKKENYTMFKYKI